jgi:signal transduction histidine kinase
MREGRDAIQNLRASTKEADDLAAVLSTLGEELAARPRDDANAQPPRLQVDIHGTPRPLRPIVRDEIYRIIGEALRNAFTHANARQIELDIHFEDRRFQVRVRDDGTGISDMESQHAEIGHFGLPGMRERADLIGSQLEVWSEAGLGTEIALTIPAVRVYATARVPHRWWLFPGKVGTKS